MLEYAIVLPAGSGKSTLASKYEFLIDIDSLHTDSFREELSQKYQVALKTGNWESYNNFECNWILPYLQKYPENFILLVHCHEKAEILGLNILGCYKPCFEIIKKVSDERGGKRGNLTIHNWNNITDATAMDSHEEIEQEVLKIYNNIIHIAIK
jgi:hypothetical protein